MKKYIFLFILLLIVLFIFKISLISVEESINKNMSVNIPKPSRYENFLNSEGQDASVFKVLYYTKENDINLVISELEEINDNNIQKVESYYMYLLSHYLESERKEVKENFNRLNEIINGNYCLFIIIIIKVSSFYFIIKKQIYCIIWLYKRTIKSKTKIYFETANDYLREEVFVGDGLIWTRK